MPALLFIAVALGAYLAGSIPTGFLVARARGIDIRKVGSGNIGATNVLRVLGKPAGIGVLLFDALKGAFACGCLPAWGARLLGPATAAQADALEVMAGIIAILGHNYTCWLGFKGGKGIATTAGVLAVWLPVALLWTVLAWVATAVLTRFVSLASIVAALVLPFIVWTTHGSPTKIVVVTMLSVLAIWKHRANIERLRAGKEPRLGKPRPVDAPTS